MIPSIMVGVRHVGNLFDSKLVNNLDSFNKCSQFIGQFNNLRSKFGHLQPDIQGNHIVVNFFHPFYDDIIQMDSKKIVYNGINQ